MRKPDFKIKQRPIVRDVHDAGMLLSEGVGLTRRLDDILEAVGSGLYKIVPVEVFDPAELESKKAVTYCDID